jgi:hypothetical protein
MRLTDQLNRPILLNGENITYRLVLRPALAVEKNSNRHAILFTDKQFTNQTSDTFVEMVS